LGKHKLIEHFLGAFPVQNSSTQVGIGDDAAVISPTKKSVVTASQLLVENIHFDLTYFPLQHLGYKAIAIAASHVVAMNAIPTQVTVGLAISNRFSLEAIEELLSGMQRCCERYHIDVVGLDINSSHTGLVISINAIGEAVPAKLTKRQGAKEKELICASGDFGAAYTGLIILEREKKTFEVKPEHQPDLVGFDYVLERQLKPEPRVDVVQELEKNRIVPSAMVNVSDGLASALLHLCHASKLGCEVYEEKIPVDVVTFESLKELNIVATTIALNGGEDYELLFTIPQSDYEKIRKVESVAIIGYMQEEAVGCQLITNDRQMIPLTAQGF
jgi:thiamine-monophosphate kinase